MKELKSKFGELSSLSSSYIMIIPLEQEKGREEQENKEEIKKEKEEKRILMLLIFLCISISSIIGAYIRIGISYYKIWHTETNYCIMYTQLVGCFIMGYTVTFKKQYYDQTSSRLSKAIYLSITSGLCGSITSFSSWQMECNKSFFLQWDLSWGNVIGSYNGGRFIEWLVCMWAGVALPISALHLGYYCGKYYLNKYGELPTTTTKTISSSPSKLKSNQNDDNNNNNHDNDNNETKIESINDEKKKEISSISNNNQESFYEGSIFILFLITITLVILLPISIYPEWIHLTYSAVFGICGAYVRYLLSQFNLTFPKFPIGTFIANVVGTWLCAMFYTISKFSVEYYTVNIQAILYGLIYGFCGCLTTVSTFVNELYTLSDSDSYVYSLSTHMTAQFGIIFIYNIYAFTTVPTSSVMPSTIDLCSVSEELCDELLDSLDCPMNKRINIGCKKTGDYNTYEGLCECGNFNGDRITELIIDSQTKFNITSSLVNVWPNDSNEILEPTEVFDLCLSYENACDHYLNRIGCPYELRIITSCLKKGINYYSPSCVCGSHDTPSDRIHELIVDNSLFRRYDTLPYAGYITLESVDFSDGFENLCNKMLDHIQCPKSQRCIVGNEIDKDYSTWKGICMCSDHSNCIPQVTDDSPDDIPDDIPEIPNYYPVDFTTRIAEDLFDSIMRPTYLTLIKKVNKVIPTKLKTSISNEDQDPDIPKKRGTWDLCWSYYDICDSFLNRINCPNDLRLIQSCGGNSSTYPYGIIEEIIGQCECGGLDLLNDRQFEVVIDALIFEKLNNKYLYIPSPNAPYTLVVHSSPFKQLSQPGRTIPLQ